MPVFFFVINYFHYGMHKASVHFHTLTTEYGVFTYQYVELRRPNEVNFVRRCSKVGCRIGLSKADFFFAVLSMNCAGLFCPKSSDPAIMLEGGGGMDMCRPLTTVI